MEFCKGFSALLWEQKESHFILVQYLEGKLWGVDVDYCSLLLINWISDREFCLIFVWKLVIALIMWSMILFCELILLTEESEFSLLLCLEVSSIFFLLAFELKLKEKFLFTGDDRLKKKRDKVSSYYIRNFSPSIKEKGRERVSHPRDVREIPIKFMDKMEQHGGVENAKAQDMHGFLHSAPADV
ncbi:hypothetical protein IEQ34_007265 [Dendrobium chrysotoxum]|uniref:Uncharacterized protein n=1 Tax=Dendrobium chrysotoxum TaxID=161865 RepID=A0AAV7H9U8_DENCH|nr:hypothetical protein IEQ34_007265 [Dendrobium chrysotoxum]